MKWNYHENGEIISCEITNLKTKNKQLAEELAQLRNNVNGKSSKEDESEKCSKLTKVVSNKCKEETELKTKNKALKERNEEKNKKMNCLPKLQLLK